MFIRATCASWTLLFQWVSCPATPQWIHKKALWLPGWKHIERVHQTSWNLGPDFHNFHKDFHTHTHTRTHTRFPWTWPELCFDPLQTVGAGIASNFILSGHLDKIQRNQWATDPRHAAHTHTYTHTHFTLLQFLLLLISLVKFEIRLPSYQLSAPSTLSRENIRGQLSFE